MVLDMYNDPEYKIIWEVSEFTGVYRKHMYLKRVEGAPRALGFIFFMVKQVYDESLFEVGKIFRKKTITFRFPQIFELITDAYNEILTNKETNEFYNRTMESIIGENHRNIPLNQDGFMLAKGTLNSTIEKLMYDHTISEIQDIVKLEHNISADSDVIKKRIQDILKEKHGKKAR